MCGIFQHTRRELGLTASAIQNIYGLLGSHHAGQSHGFHNFDSDTRFFRVVLGFANHRDLYGIFLADRQKEYGILLNISGSKINKTARARSFGDMVFIYNGIGRVEHVPGVCN